MDQAQLESTLSAAEAALASDDGVDLAALGFWKAVAAAKRDPNLRDRYATRIAAIDRKAFERWAFFHVPIRIGTWLMMAFTAVFIGVVGAAYYAPDPWDGLLLLGGTGGLLVTTHGLGHLGVGRAVGIRFTHWFIGTLLRPQPGVKIDYESYLHTPARRRALMHASGAVVTKSLPFLMLGAAWGMDAPAWAWWILGTAGVVTILTDVLWSVRSSDWKRYQRERGYVASKS